MRHKANGIMRTPHNRGLDSGLASVHSQLGHIHLAEVELVPVCKIALHRMALRCIPTIPIRSLPLWLVIQPHVSYQ